MRPNLACIAAVDVDNVVVVIESIEDREAQETGVIVEEEGTVRGLGELKAAVVELVVGCCSDVCWITRASVFCVFVATELGGIFPEVD